MDQYKKALVDKLVQIYPYSRKWFESKSYSTCMAMLKHPPKKQVQKQEPRRPITKGNMILTDSGKFEEIQD